MQYQFSTTWRLMSPANQLNVQWTFLQICRKDTNSAWQKICSLMAKLLFDCISWHRGPSYLIDSTSQVFGPNQRSLLVSSFKTVKYIYFRFPSFKSNNSSTFTNKMTIKIKIKRVIKNERNEEGIWKFIIAWKHLLLKAFASFENSRLIHSRSETSGYYSQHSTV